MRNPNVERFCHRHGITVGRELGLPGQDGVVFESSRLTAIKFFDSAERFIRELEVYQTLMELGIHSILGHAVPVFLMADGEFFAIEMTIVQPPYFLDFAGALYAQEVPAFEADATEENMAKLNELFGDRLPDVLAIQAEFRRLTGFTVLDLHPGNVRFPDPEE